MPKRIIVTHTCHHEGKKLFPIVEKFWDCIPQNITKVCYCQGINKPTLMNYKIEIKEDTKPE